MQALVAAAGALLALAHAVLVVPRLPEPTAPPLPGDPPKPPYRDLVTPGRVWVLVAGCFVCGLACWLVPSGQWPLWAVYVGGFGPLVAIDALTTYLPRRLHYLALAELGIALACFGTLTSWADAGRALSGGLLLGGLFWLVWRAGSGIGFGDVRLAVPIGIVASATSLTMLLRAALFGALIGAAWGIAVSLLRRRRADLSPVFPYGPALWLGPFVAVLVSAWTG
ncbi:MAG: leader peptidase (prepilin peptidase)/N-methyltransferase [Propionibacteriaceae bacterium]|nr:leader peptidase (prepilin peptidase)/N-methyltransferase [Propionibacteriaceae bacterium]